MLKKWEKYLEGPDSIKVLADGWLVGGKGLELILAMGNEIGMNANTKYTFTQLYGCPDPDQSSAYGYKCWDEFFTRRFKKMYAVLRAQMMIWSSSTHANRLPCSIPYQMFSSAIISRAKSGLLFD